jgi:hypothetical protein
MREQLKREAKGFISDSDKITTGEATALNIPILRRAADLIARQDEYIDQLVGALVHIRDTNHITRIDGLDLIELPQPPRENS